MRVAILLAILLLSVGCASASDTDWTWSFYGDTAAFGTAVGASDGGDSRDALITSANPVYAATYHEHDVDGWNGASGFYQSDIREPLSLVPGTSKKWVFYLWGDPSLTPQATYIGLSWGYRSPFPAFDKMDYRLTYVRSVEGVTGGSVPVGTSILLSEHPQGTWSFPAYRTTDGRTGYMFELTATVVPEPSSLAALGAGLLPLASSRLRRRKG